MASIDRYSYRGIGGRAQLMRFHMVNPHVRHLTTRAIGHAFYASRPARPYSSYNNQTFTQANNPQTWSMSFSLSTTRSALSKERSIRIGYARTQVGNKIHFLRLSGNGSVLSLSKKSALLPVLIHSSKTMMAAKDVAQSNLDSVAVLSTPLSPLQAQRTDVPNFSHHCHVIKNSAVATTKGTVKKGTNMALESTDGL